MKYYKSIFLAVAVLMPSVLLNAKFLEVESAREITNGKGGFPAGIFGRSDGVGFSMDSLGDFDGDGIEDLVVGAPYEEDRLNDVYGAIYLFFMNSDGTVKDYQKIANGIGGLPTRTTLYDSKFGFSVQNMGDIDGNGVVDVAVGAPEMSATGVSAPYNEPGAIFILLMNADGTVLNYSLVGVGADRFPTYVNDRDDFGSGLANIGDIDGDGIAELMVSAPFWSNDMVQTLGMLQTTALNDSFVGALFILSLNDDGTMKNVSLFPGDLGSSELTAFYDNYPSHTYLGYKMANIGDLNLDGIDDVAVTQGSGSAIEIYYLNSDGSLQGIASIGNGIGGVPADTLSEATYSLSVDGIGDFDGDGVVDLIIGDEGDATLDGVAGASYRVGAAFLALLNADGSVKDIDKIADGVNGFPSNELQSTGYFGSSVLNMGFSTNGFPVVAVGESWASASSDNADRNVGAFWMLELGYLQSQAPTVPVTPVTPTTPAGETRIETRYYYANTIARLSYDLDEDGFLGSGASFTGSLPGSLAFAGDVLQGFISPVGTYTFNVTGTDGVNTLILTVTIEVMEPTLTPVITGITLNGVYKATTVITPPTHGEAAVMAHHVASVNVGEALTMEFQWDQIKGSDGFTIVGGSLPDGLVLDRENGVITGVPTTAGVYEFLISVKDWRGRGYQWVLLTVE